MDNKDSLYAKKQGSIKDFVFDKSVVSVFQDMVNRSIPGYSDLIHQIGSFARRYVRPDTNVYDLGCSLGAVTFSIRHSVNVDGCCIISVDNSSLMIDRLQKNLTRDIAVIPVEPVCDDVLSVKMSNASLVVLNFTLQFISRSEKDVLIQKIYNSLNSGGALVLSEKIVSTDIEEQDFIEKHYFDLKRHNGYNELEISQKREALENVLLLESPDEHLDRLKNVGFSKCISWYSNLNFSSFLAIK